MRYYALTAKGYDRLEKGLSAGSMDGVIGAFADLEEENPNKPHTDDEAYQLIGRPTGFQIALRRATKNGYIEEIQPGDDRFDW